MKFPQFRFLVMLIAIFYLLQWGVMVQAQAAGKNWTELIPTVLFFGDSIVDTGNNNQLASITRANHVPYGRDFVGKKATGRFSNGKVISDMIVSYMGLKNYVPPYVGTNLTVHDLLTGVNFASGGTGFDIATSTFMKVISMEKQLEMFEEYKRKLAAVVGDTKANSIISKAGYLICAGTNDVVHYFQTTSSEKQNTTKYSEQLKEMATQYVKDLYKLGARRFAVVGLPPVGCLPYQRTAAGGHDRVCVANRNEFALTYNTKLKAEIDRLMKTNKLPGSKLDLVDIYPIIMELIQNPEKHGFKESKKGCCGTGLVEVAVLCNKFSQTCANASEYVFWDSYHPTERAYEIIVDDVIDDALAALT
ncbi:hypothetical protein LUZ61_013698 [Rhynchospora tenuis]|uniref:Uncharacterized protein n=1 Tax=Rhynchospora tenuis TaxID=198213 RepID=A0AAD5Z2V2_9POAL|nr:hypothetical protein LUZ61_013698 [Rhynchospora tenuis]